MIHPYQRLPQVKCYTMLLTTNYDGTVDNYEILKYIYGWPLSCHISLAPGLCSRRESSVLLLLSSTLECS